MRKKERIEELWRGQYVSEVVYLKSPYRGTSITAARDSKVQNILTKTRKTERKCEKLGTQGAMRWDRR